MEACLGPFPVHMTKSKEARSYFDSQGRLLHSRTASVESCRHVKAMKALAVRPQRCYCAHTPLAHCNHASVRRVDVVA
jgi:hypothetical protein